METLTQEQACDRLLPGNGRDQPAYTTLKQVRNLVNASVNLIKVGDDLAERAINSDSGIQVEECDSFEDLVDYGPQGKTEWTHNNTEESEE